MNFPLKIACQHLQFRHTKSDTTCTVYILYFQESFTTQYGGEQKQKAVWSVVIGFWGGQQKRESVVYY